MTDLLRARVLSRFTCLGDKCEDTCCRGWSMQVDAATLSHYKRDAPELLEAVEPAKETPWIMRKDAGGVCVKLEGGLCGIHKKYGETFLGDACYFYPRATRRLGDSIVMTATMSCPEIARLVLAGDDAAALEEVAVSRLPQELRDYLPPEFTQQQALVIHHAFLGAANDKKADGAEQNFLRIASASRSLERIDKKEWSAMAAYYLQHADARLPTAQPNINDPFNLLHALAGLIAASKKKPPERLAQTIAEMETMLAVSLDWEKILIHADEKSFPAYLKLQTLWKKHGEYYTPVLRRWLTMQLSLAMYPFGGFGRTLSERVTVIGVRLATFKLALMCGCGMYGAVLPQEAVVRIMQSLSRFMDHLADSAFSLRIYAETGWMEESRMRGLLE
ncbi:MAG: flagellin lysine-N-methylase [Pseudomonadota bacterium]|nr:flagellin lysine-N-methylase [Pseudomonadota bacterium]MDE3037457.1 flagellin lysine-N-methylase [Pseudomonadota bacterium]